ncbi:YncE family protein [candidate division WOR-3 bacterium]|uniref:YncE family protein n=1 Tax=candidate division WOR-3 bacterium TaxID=2052148 RepID=A0A938BUD5_UNCW3|nr:YncE family protein [candidate division WOR-3 bacterium]
MTRGTKDRVRGRYSIPTIRAAKAKVLLRALALGSLLAMPTHAQYLETTIDLCPGGVGSVLQLDCIAVNPATHTVYVGGDGWVAVVDGAGLSFEKRIQVDSRCRALVYVPAKNKLYVAGWGSPPDSVVYVIDCGTNEVLSRVRVGLRPHALCYDWLDNKVYCANYSSNTVSAIDVSGDSVVATIQVDSQPRALCFNPVDRKVYCANFKSASVTVIGATMDTVVATVNVGNGPVSFCHNSRDNKVYCGRGYLSGHFTVIDGAADTVLATLQVGGEQNSIAYSPLTGRVYCTNEGAIVVIDGAGDSIRGSSAGGYPWQSVLCNPANGKLYAATDDGRMGVIDGVTDSLLAVFILPDDSRRLAVDPTLNRVYGAYVNTPSVACVDGAGDSLLAVVRTGVKPFKICYNPVEDKLYTVNRDNCGSVSVVDAATNSLLSTIPMHGYPWEAACDSANDKVFVSLRSGHGGDSGVVVIDCRADAVEAVASVWDDPTRLLDYHHEPDRECAPNSKVYCSQVRLKRHSVAVIDARTDSVLTTIPFNWGAPYKMAVNHSYDKLYVANYDGNQLAIISSATDSVVKLVQVYAGPGFTIHYNPAAEKLYASTNGMYCGYVTIVSGRDDSIIRVLETPFIGMACQSPAKPDVFMYGTEGVFVIDGLGDSVLTRISTPNPQYSLAMECDIGHDKVYCSVDSTVVIIDALTYRVTRTIRVGQYPGDMVWVPRHSRMFVANMRSSSISVIRDTPLAVEEQRAVATEPSPPTVVRRSVPLRSATTGDICDVSGRRLKVLNPGANNIGHLAPGVYFVREELPASSHKPAVRKVVLTK